jgi:hypothetical protein
MFRITNQAEEEMLDNQEDDGRIFSKKERANKILPTSRWS